MKKTLATMALAMAVLAPTAPATATETPDRLDWVFPRGLAYAPNEDGCYVYRCVWDARHQGNGRGQSLIITRWHHRFVFQPITHERAHRLHLLYCQRRDVTCGGYDD